ncbi:MAG TPA: hypothetical protein VF185_01910 [Patescibacteria group bacterium]
MDRVKNKYPQETELNKDFIAQNLGLVADEERQDFLRLSPSTHYEKPQVTSERKPLEKPEDIFQYFDGVKSIEPDAVCRPKGDTTFFTSAGVQHIETVLRTGSDLKREAFVVSQPVIRSQFMDKIKEGTSSSFINFSVESVDAKPDDFIKLSNQFIKLITSLGVSASSLRFQVENVPDRWGSRKFTKTQFTIYAGGIELGECVYIHDYPVTEDKKISIVDIGFGIERLNWAINATKHYFTEFDELYDQADADKIASIIDPIRTMVLIAGEGTKPSSHDHGYRLRQLSKRFVQRSIGTNTNVAELVDTSYEFWKKWGYKPTVSKEEVLKVVSLENDRNYNGLFLETLGREGTTEIYVDINQPTQDFLKQVGFSLPKDKIDEIVKKIA